MVSEQKPSFLPTSWLSNAEAPHLTAALKNTGHPLLPAPSERVSSWREQGFSISHHAPSYSLLMLSPSWIQSRDGDSLLPPRPHLWNAGSTLGTACWEDWCPQHSCWLMASWFHGRRGKLGGPQATSLSSPHPHTISIQVPEQKCHSESSSSLSPPLAPEPWLGDYAWEGEADYKTDTS